MVRLSQTYHEFALKGAEMELATLRTRIAEVDRAISALKQQGGRRTSQRTVVTGKSESPQAQAMRRYWAQQRAKAKRGEASRVRKTDTKTI